MELADIQKQLIRSGELFLCLRVQPKAGRHELVEVREEDRGGKMEPVLRVKVKAPAEDGKANKEACELVAELFHVPKSCVTLILGHTSREKVVKITLLR